MSKTPSKKNKKSLTATKKNTSTAVKTQAKSKVSRTMNMQQKKQTPVVSSPAVTASAADFFANKKMMITLIVLILAGALYLMKDSFIVALVNGKPIYRWTLVKKLEDQGGKQILDSLITESLVKQELKKANIFIDQTEVDAEIKGIEERLTAQGMTLDRALAQQGMTREQLIEDIVLQKSAEKIVADKISITDEEVQKYIEDNKEFFPEGSTPEEMTDAVKSQLLATKTNEAIQAWVQSLQESANVVYWREYKTNLPN